MLFHFMDGPQSWARTELERRQIRTIDDAITQAKALTDFRQEKSYSAEEDDEGGSHNNGGGGRGECKEQRPQPKRRGEEQKPYRHDTYRSNGKKSGDHGNTVKKIQVAKGDGCYECGGPHVYAK